MFHGREIWYDKQKEDFVWKTIKCYRGDRVAQSMLPYITDDRVVELYNPVSQAIIEL